MNRLEVARMRRAKRAIDLGTVVLGIGVTCSCSSASDDSGGNQVSSNTTVVSSSTGGATSVDGTTAVGGIASTVTGAGTTTGATATGGTATTTGTGATGGTSSATTSAPGKDCADINPLNTSLLTGGLLTDFESYDGTVAMSDWGLAVNGIWSDADVVYLGPYTWSDATGTFTASMVGGCNRSSRAVGIKNTMATDYGGGIGIWMSCVDASVYTGGLSFYMRGTTGNGTVTVAIAMEDTTASSADGITGGTCTATKCANPSATVEISPDWTLVQIPWASFTGGIGLAGTSVTATGARITGLSFSVGVAYVVSATDSTVYEPVPAAFSMAIDNVGFY